ncbi:MAG TPA: glycosyltransferase [Bacillota bacterium]|nr:glycosyltransferase [Bacillota bacterium]
MTSRSLLFLDHAGVLGGAELSLLDVAGHYRGQSEVVLFSDGPFRLALEQAGLLVHVMAADARLRGVRRSDGLRGLMAATSVLREARRLAQRARAHHLVHCNSQKAFVVGALAARMARRPVVWHLRDMLTAEHFSRTGRLVVVRLANALAARVICNSQATADAFIASGGRAGLVSVVYNGIEPEDFPDMDVAEARRRTGLPDGPLVGSFSRLAPWKGQHVLLDALVQLPGVHAAIVGEALFGEDAYAASLRVQCDRLGLADRVHFLGFRRDIPLVMAATDIVVHTAVAPEPFGRMVVEGMLSGRPVVAADAGGVREIVSDGATGRLTPPGDAGALAAAIGSLLGNPEAAAGLAQAGRAWARERFSRERMLADFDHVIEGVLARSRT